MNKCLSVVSLLALGVADVPGQCGYPTYSSYSYPTYSAYQAPVVVKQTEVVPVAVYQPIFVPTYTASYQPTPPQPPAPAPAAAPAPPAQPCQSEKIATALDRIMTRLETLERPQQQAPAYPPPQQSYPPQQPSYPPAQQQSDYPRMPHVQPSDYGEAPQAQRAPVAGVFGQRCASCHDDGVAPSRGGGLALTRQGQLGRLDDATARRVLTSVLAGRMPPRGQLTPDEKSQLVSILMQR